MNKPTDTTTQLDQLGARQYDPVTGRFINVDPLVAETAQPYSYANNNPVTNSDPTGLHPEDPGTGGSCPQTVCGNGTNTNGPGPTLSNPPPTGTQGGGNGGGGGGGGGSQGNLLGDTIGALPLLAAQAASEQADAEQRQAAINAYTGVPDVGRALNDYVSCGSGNLSLEKACVGALENPLSGIPAWLAFIGNLIPGVSCLNSGASGASCGLSIASMVPIGRVAEEISSVDELAQIASRIKNVGDVHPAQLNQQVIAVGLNDEGDLVAASNTSSSFTQGQRAIMDELGITRAPSRTVSGVGLHAEENLLGILPNPTGIGLSAIPPCPGNCLPLLTQLDIPWAVAP